LTSSLVQTGQSLDNLISILWTSKLCRDEIFNFVFGRKC